MKKFWMFLFCLSSVFAHLEITNKNFNEIGQSKKPVILDVNAKWCGPCRRMGEVFDQVSREYPQVLFAKLDFDSQGYLVQDLGVEGLPTLLYFKPGQSTPAMKTTGFLSREEFREKIDEFLKN